MKLSLLIAVALLLFLDADAYAAKEGFCELNAKGDENFTIRIPSKPAAEGEDSPEAVKAFQSNSAFSHYWVHANPEKNKALVAIAGLLVNCGNKDTRISFLNNMSPIKPIIETSRVHTLFPKRYMIRAALPTISSPSGDFIIGDIIIKNTTYHVSEPGYIEITQFDTSVVKGNFSLTVTTASLVTTASPTSPGRPAELEKVVTLTGNFEFPCDGDQCKK